MDRYRTNSCRYLKSGERPGLSQLFLYSNLNYAFDATLKTVKRYIPRLKRTEGNDQPENATTSFREIMFFDRQVPPEP